MAIRVYLSRFSVEALAEGGQRIALNMAEHLNTTGILASFGWTLMSQGSVTGRVAGVNGVPIVNTKLVFIDSPAPSSAFDQLDSVAGVVRIPLGNLNDNVRDLGRNRFISEFARLGLARQGIDRANTNRELLENALKTIHPEFNRQGDFDGKEDRFE